jgi:hypothetical protein
LRTFSLLFTLDSWMARCLGVDLVALNLNHDLWPSYIWIFVSSSRFGKFSVIICLISFLFLCHCQVPLALQ